jgi:hypothetical protein
MADRTVNIDVGADPSSVRLARALLIAELATQLMAAWMIVDMVERGKLSYRLAWHWGQLRERARARAVQERRIRIEIGRVLYEAERVLNG